MQTWTGMSFKKKAGRPLHRAVRCRYKTFFAAPAVLYRCLIILQVREAGQDDLFRETSRSLSLVYLICGLLFFMAMAMALFVPMITTSFFPRVIAV